MRPTDRKPETLTRVKPRNYFQPTERLVGGSEEGVKHYTMFLAGALSFFIGFWAITCLVKAIMDQGPVAVVKLWLMALTGN